MSLRNFIIGLSLVLFLGGCTSLSKDQIDAAMIDRLASVEIVTMSGRDGQIFIRNLRQTMFSSYGADAKYRLASTMSISASETFSVRGVSSDFKKMTMTISFTLTDIIAVKQKGAYMRRWLFEENCNLPGLNFHVLSVCRAMDRKYNCNRRRTRSASNLARRFLACNSDCSFP